MDRRVRVLDWVVLAWVVLSTLAGVAGASVAVVVLCMILSGSMDKIIDLLMYLAL